MACNNVGKIGEEVMTTGSTKENFFGGLELKLPISDHKSMMSISDLLRPQSKKLRKSLEYKC
jgi:hypothetical protein